MEAMDIFLATVRDATYVLVHHPVLSILGAVFGCMCLLRFYVRLTLGMCDCDRDMTGKTVLITGASAGIGKETALDLAKRNARVLLACRNPGKAKRVAEEIRTISGNQKVIVKQLDLCSFQSVRECAEDVLKTEERLDVLINNAGVIGEEWAVTKDGCEMTMQANHLGHFLLTLLLLDLLKRSAPSRIINVSSTVYKWARMDVNDLNKRCPKQFLYINSKMANVLFTTELASRLQGTGVTVNSLHPGMVKTDILNPMKGFIIFITRLLMFFYGKNSKEGAQTTIYLAVHPEVETVTGKYFSDCKEDKLSNKALNKDLARRLFETSEKIVGVTFHKS